MDTAKNVLKNEQVLSSHLQSGRNRGYCHDCGKKIEVRKNKIKNGMMLVYDDNGEKIKILKCNDCFKNNPSLINFRKCEVYSRIVGYLRPVHQWNVGKKKEFGERLEYELSN